jgi:hypothetical protein
MPHGALLQARQAIGLVRYLPRWQQNLLAAALLAAGSVLLALGHLAGVAPLALVGLFAITRIRHHPRKRPPPTA